MNWTSETLQRNLDIPSSLGGHLLHKYRASKKQIYNDCNVNAQ